MSKNKKTSETKYNNKYLNNLKNISNTKLTEINAIHKKYVNKINRKLKISDKDQLKINRQSTRQKEIEWLANEKNQEKHKKIHKTKFTNVLSQLKTKTKPEYLEIISNSKPDNIYE